jgi:hypothetical protein
MENNEFSEAEEFLNSKEMPTSDDIIRLFFNEMDTSELIDEDEAEEIDFDSLGEPDDAKTFTGSEWIASRLIWDTADGPICKVNLIKIGGFENTDGQYSAKPIFPFGKEVIDIEYEEVKELSFDEQFDNALEDENFEEAARLRDYNIGLSKLLIHLKPKILKALDEEDIKALDEFLTKIRVYRTTL